MLNKFIKNQYKPEHLPISEFRELNCQSTYRFYKIHAVIKENLSIFPPSQISIVMNEPIKLHFAVYLVSKLILNASQSQKARKRIFFVVTHEKNNFLFLVHNLQFSRRSKVWSRTNKKASQHAIHED